MIRLFERKILDEIHFVERFIEATNSCIKNNDSNYKLVKKDIMNVLSTTKYEFENTQNHYLCDVNKGDYVFRLMFDIKNDSILTYIYVLKDGAFLENGLSHFGFMLNSFDLTGHIINQKFGFNSRNDFAAYIQKMISIFEDFKERFVLSQS